MLLKSTIEEGTWEKEHIHQRVGFLIDAKSINRRKADEIGFFVLDPVVGQKAETGAFHWCLSQIC